MALTYKISLLAKLEHDVVKHGACQLAVNAETSPLCNLLLLACKSIRVVNRVYDITCHVAGEAVLQ